jgi:hypothetical protein
MVRSLTIWKIFFLVGVDRGWNRLPIMTAEKAKAFLESLALQERIRAVAEDVDSKKNEFAALDVFTLAELLEVPDPDQPGDSWSRSVYAEKRSLEEYVDLNAGILEEFSEMLPGGTSARRAQTVTEKCKAYAAGEIDSLDFLKPKERESILEQLEERDLQSLMDNGIGGVATYCVSDDENELWFEGEIEDDGSCIDLKGPYDGIDGCGRDPDEWVSTEL